MRRTDLTFIDGVLIDAHEHDDQKGDGPFVNLEPREHWGTGAERVYTVAGDEHTITVNVVPRKRTPNPHRHPALSHDRGHGS